MPKPTEPGPFLFIDETLRFDGGEKKKIARKAQNKSVRAHATKTSSDARLDTLLRRRAAERNSAPGQRVFRVQPLPCVAVEKHREVVKQRQDQENALATQNHKILGGSIPVAQANEAVLAQFLDRFRTPDIKSERPWVEVVMGSSGHPKASSMMMVETALRANANALFANDLQQPELYKHAIKQHLWAISKLQVELKSPRWADPEVLYTCMILTLYECIVPTGDPLARLIHVRGVAHLFQQRGAQRFANGMEHRCFRPFRINILMVCLHDRKACFLAETEWKTIPFSGDTPPKTVLDLLHDILLELPGVLELAESLRKAELPRHTLLQKALELAYWVRRLIQDLERWRAMHIWTHPAISKMAHAKHLGLLELCELGTGQDPYEMYLGEALNSYCAAHLMLARIAWALADKSGLLGALVRAPYGLREMIEAIVLVSKRHVNAKTVGLVSMMVTTFPLGVAENSMKELGDKELLATVKGLTDQVNQTFARRFNIRYLAESVV